nr:MAG TPA: hypothetical protein [Caudoviricetes sp.]
MPVGQARKEGDWQTKNEEINEMHRLGLKYRNARKYKVEMVECDG